MSILFNGSTQYITMTNSPSEANLGAVTLVGWVYMAGKPAGGNEADIIFVGNGASAGSSRFKLTLTNTGSIISVGGGGRALDGDGVQSYVNPVDTIFLNIWYHVAAVFDYSSKVISVYQDGVFLSSSAALSWGATQTDSTSSLAKFIGANGANSNAYLNGKIEDARIYTRLLSAAEIKTIFTCRGTDGIRSGLQSRWLLSEGANGSTASGAASVKDGTNTSTGTPQNSPTYDIRYTNRRRKVFG